MDDQPEDRSDQSESVERQLIATFEKIGSLTEQYIRAQIGDEAYDAYVARRKTEAEFDGIVGDQVKSPHQVVSERAAEIARELVEPGDPITADDDRRAMAAASLEWLQGSTSEDDEYWQVAIEASDELQAVVELEMSMHYSGIQARHIDGQMANFEIELDEGLALRIVLEREQEELKESASYVKQVNKLPHVIAAIDTKTYSEFDGITMKKFKADTLGALKSGAARLQQLVEEG
jgi:hypothetical protein